MIVLTCGCFDPLHIGHIAYLRRAADLGRLVVGLTTDANINKGAGRPLMPWAERYSALAELKCVHEIVPNYAAEETIYRVCPDIYVKGKEYEERLPEQELVERLGGRVVFIDARPIYSSTKLITGELLRERLAAIGASAR